MNATTPALVAAAAGVAVGHAVLPDHWVPLGLLAHSRGYSPRAVARLSGLAGLAHVIVSLALGAVVIALGLQLRSSVEHAQNTIVGCLLIATGVGFAVYERRHHHHDHDHRHEHHQHRPGRLAMIVPFGAAASPDLTILPVFLAATAIGATTAAATLVAFAIVTIVTIVTLTLLAARGGDHLPTAWLERWGNSLTAAVLIAIGALVLTGALW